MKRIVAHLTVVVMALTLAVGAVTFNGARQEVLACGPTFDGSSNTTNVSIYDYNTASYTHSHLRIDIFYDPCQTPHPFTPYFYAWLDNFDTHYQEAQYIREWYPDGTLFTTYQNDTYGSGYTRIDGLTLWSTGISVDDCCNSYISGPFNPGTSGGYVHITV